MKNSGCGETISLGFWLAVVAFACSMVTVNDASRSFHTASVFFLVVALGPWAALFTFALLVDVGNGILAFIGAVLEGIWNIITGTVEWVDDQIWRVIRWWQALKEKRSKKNEEIDTAK